MELLLSILTNSLLILLFIEGLLIKLLLNKLQMGIYHYNIILIILDY